MALQRRRYASRLAELLVIAFLVVTVHADHRSTAPVAGASNPESVPLHTGEEHKRAVIQALQPDATRQEAILQSHLHLLNELSERRRLNILFRNEQATSYGVPVRFVNSSRGNLTFVRRDLVAIARIPIVLARAYDSSSGATADFGPGWRLTLAETITHGENDRLVYTDDSGSQWTLIKTDDDRYELQPSVPSDVDHVRRLEGELRVVHKNGWSKSFEPYDEGFRLTEIADPYGNSLRLAYDGGGLARVSGPHGRFVAIERDGLRRVSRVSDDQGRSASYRYDPSGRLRESLDLGGNGWTYVYDEFGRLQRANDPRGNELLRAAYDAQGKVSMVEILGAPYRYQYKALSTRVLDHKDRATWIEHNSVGMATAITNAEGLRSELRLDGQNRVTTLLRNGDVAANFVRDRNGQLISVRTREGSRANDLSLRSSGPGQMMLAGNGETKARITTNPLGGLVQVSDELSDRRYSPEGDLFSTRRGEQVVRYSFNKHGQVESILSSGGNAQLAYQPDGKLHFIQFPDGTTHEYHYSALGFRESINRSDGSRKTLAYDVAGNLTRADGANPDGESGVHLVDLDAYNRPRSIGYSTGKRITVTYDAQGNPQTVKQSFDDPKVSGERGGDTETKIFEYLYDSTNRVVAVAVDNTIAGSHEYTDGEPDLRTQQDHKTMRVPAAKVRQSSTVGDLASIVYARPQGSYYDVVQYDETLGAFGIATARISLPDAVAINSIERRMLPTGLAGHRMHERVAFDLASNVILLPPEYDTINCYPPNCVFTGIKLKGNGAQTSVSIAAGGSVTLVASKQVTGECAQGVVWSLSDSYGHSGAGLGSSLTRTWYYDVPGTYGVNASGECNGCDVLGSASLTVIVTAPPPPPVCAVPVNFRQTGVTPLADGSLRFDYDWDSSNGSKAQLSACQMGESVTYPGPSPFPRPSPPFPPGNHANPTEFEFSAEEAAFDVHFVPPGDFVKPYSSSSYTATQIYRYRCPCQNNNNWVTVMGPLQIVRSVSQNANGTWKYTITKPTNGQASVDPLP
jgi:YD repeat-containing protein